MSSGSSESGLSIADARFAIDNASEEMEPIPSTAHPINRGLGGASFLKRDPLGAPTYFVKKVDDDANIKCDFPSMVRLAQQCSSIGLSPALRESDEESGLVIFEALPDTWKFGTTKEFRRQQICSKAASALKSMHSTDALSASYSPFDHVRFLANELDIFANKIGDRVYPEYFHTMSDWIIRIERAVTAAGTDLVPCKGENNLSDFMIGPNGDLQIVDFDQAGSGDPYSDLGALANEYCRTDDDIFLLVEAYDGVTPSSVVARVKLYMIATAFKLGVWGLVSQLRKPDTEIELQKYGQNQLLYCRSALSRWDVGRLLRDV